MRACVRACVLAALSMSSFFDMFLVVCGRRFVEEVLKFLQKELECSAVKYRAVIWLASKQAIPTRVFSVLQCFVSQVLLEQLFLRKFSLSLSLFYVLNLSSFGEFRCCNLVVVVVKQNVPFFFCS